MTSFVKRLEQFRLTDHMESHLTIPRTLSITMPASSELNTTKRPTKLQLTKSTVTCVCHNLSSPRTGRARSGTVNIVSQVITNIQTTVSEISEQSVELFQFHRGQDVVFMLMLVAFLMMFIRRYEWGVALATLLVFADRKST